jgi:ribonuclease BN (tRNA processing enzyme)
VTTLAKGADILVSEVISLDIMAEFLPQIIQSKEGIQALLFHMAHEHLVPEEVGKMAAAAGVKMVVLSHVGPGRPQDPDARYTDGVKQYFSGPVVLAKDLMSF